MKALIVVDMINDFIGRLGSNNDNFVLSIEGLWR